MHPDLESIVSADEEARSRVTLAEERSARELASARASRDAAIATRRKEAFESLEKELDVIRAEGEARLSELRQRQSQYLAGLARIGEEKFEEAVALYLRLVCEVAP
jgi:DNA anti-recombination protein RmuC